jgi:hypothetical protein
MESFKSELKKSLATRRATEIQAIEDKGQFEGRMSEQEKNTYLEDLLIFLTFKGPKG